MRLLGIDPGLRLTGYGVVDLLPGRLEPTLVEGGVIKLDATQSVEDRLVELHQELLVLIDRLGPQAVAVEKLYSHYAHPVTAILMGHARGVILLSARERGLRLSELAATEVKKAMTGHGHASKEQVQAAVAHQCGLAKPPQPADVGDAIAIALTAGRRAAHQRLLDAPRT